MVFGPNDAAPHNQVTITSTATLIRPAAGDRSNCTVRNIGAVDCYLGSSAAVTTGTGFPLYSAGKDAYDVHWPGTIYAITASSTTTVAYFEEDT